jgi:hypothetical protein
MRNSSPEARPVGPGFLINPGKKGVFSQKFYEFSVASRKESGDFQRFPDKLPYSE